MSGIGSVAGIAVAAKGLPVKRSLVARTTALEVVGTLVRSIAMVVVKVARMRGSNHSRLEGCS